MALGQGNPFGVRVALDVGLHECGAVAERAVVAGLASGRRLSRDGWLDVARSVVAVSQGLAVLAVCDDAVREVRHSLVVRLVAGWVPYLARLLDSAVVVYPVLGLILLLLEVRDPAVGEDVIGGEPDAFGIRWHDVVEVAVIVAAAAPVLPLVLGSWRTSTVPSLLSQCSRWCLISIRPSKPAPSYSRVMLWTSARMGPSVQWTEIAAPPACRALRTLNLVPGNSALSRFLRIRAVSVGLTRRARYRRTRGRGSHRP